MRKLQFDKVVYPSFMGDMREYRKCLEIIAKQNFIE